MAIQNLLTKYRGKNSRNVEQSLNVEIARNERLLPQDQIVHTIDQYQLYLDEREKCTKYRLIFAINPICSNVLFNAITEVVQNEGSNSAITLSNHVDGKDILYNDIISEYKPLNTSDLSREQAIRDSEYGHEKLGKFTYHCGIDIFNNPRLRSSGFVNMQNVKAMQYDRAALDSDKTITPDNSYGYTASTYTVDSVFNTIRDYARDGSGDMISETYGSGSETQNLHLYNHDNLYTFLNAYQNKLTEINGWYGFKNPTSISISHLTTDSNGGNVKVSIDKMMPRNKGCELYEMYPDRSLFSFIPKINEYRDNREEPNWDYCLTYPYKKYYKWESCDLVYDYNNDIHGIKVVSTWFSNDGDTIYIRTAIKHNLQTGDRVEFAFPDDTIVKFKCFVNGTGNAKLQYPETIFSVRTHNVEAYWPDDTDNLRVSKVDNGYTCDYYYREFRKIPDIEYATATPQSGEILTDAAITACNKWHDFMSTNTKMGFARNIYNDPISQILFNDNVDLSHILDHRGRPISEIYLTIIKRHKGTNDWYYNKVYSGETMEFNHCFGKVTSGFDLPFREDDYENDDIVKKLKPYNVHCIHNIFDVDQDDIKGYNIPDSAPALEDDIEYETVDDSGNSIYNEFFLGDIVEYSPNTLNETVLENVYHRFNTEQRELIVDNSGSTYKDIIFDEMVLGDYDFDDDGSTGNRFLINEKTFNTSLSVDGVNVMQRGNVFPEGYYYQPHHKIAIREFSESITMKYDTQVKFTDISTGESGVCIVTLSKANSAITSGDTLLFRCDDVPYYCTVEYISGTTLVIKMSDEYIEKTEELAEIYDGDSAPLMGDNVYLFIPNPSMPTGAEYRPGSNGAYAYRAFRPYYECLNNKLVNATFTNDAIYLEDTINLYVRRQDPLGYYRLNYKSDYYENNNLRNLVPEGESTTITSSDLTATSYSTC